MLVMRPNLKEES